jgi:hypothetical protein
MHKYFVRARWDRICSVMAGLCFMLIVLRWAWILNISQETVRIDGFTTAMGLFSTLFVVAAVNKHSH